mmetsp:Transcript_28485/g.42101  ORF Transcript_28485/g.42101 Transcript_28485/m.42101 type:complete len:346 (+) Transcript_28485:181-1218(+)|eukprot:CAMPEP_0194221032 /NCGR_PEP_ID=MMETSP0156-20130528/29743_1 /TAXON_ID=33649 /ORGANISM="Thalassionema nitzschioides, Strain L26-B" /LENGTH=345 /DNA_ID=CAMNT_0038951307 /DNA_START=125 /DNA_END=1162 /DNA_ORIENTATION=-
MNLLLLSTIATCAQAFVIPQNAKVGTVLKDSGMDAYDAQMRALMNRSQGGQQQQQQQPPPLSNSGSVAQSSANPIAAFESSQAESVNAIAAAIPDLASKPDHCWIDESIDGCLAKIDARDAPGPANIAWLSSLCVDNKISSLTIFNGPLTDVPHLVSRCAIINGEIAFFLDFRPRAYGAYEMIQSDGTYPGPDVLGRVAFEYSGARRAFDTNYGDEEVTAFMTSTLSSFENVVLNTAGISESDQLTRGPLAIDITMPLTDNNVAAVLAARQQAASFWLKWALDDSHGHRPGAPVNSQYVYDSKYKQNCYSALLPIYSGWFGAADGAKLAAADSGPLDEGYVGGGS